MTPPAPLKKMLIKQIQKHQKISLTVTEVRHTLHLKKKELPILYGPLRSLRETFLSIPLHHILQSLSIIFIEKYMINNHHELLSFDTN